jgi:hypothetical protein
MKARKTGKARREQKKKHKSGNRNQDRKNANKRRISDSAFSHSDY